MSNLRTELMELRKHIDALIAFLPGSDKPTSNRSWTPERRAKFMATRAAKKSPATKKKS